MGILDELNEAQAAAVTAGDGPVMIVAGPGTGKTKTLSARVAWLLEGGVAPGEILALTFTRKAAGEMRSRVDGLAGAGAGRCEITTFHALGMRLLAAGEDARGFVSNDERLELIRGLKRPTGLAAGSARELALALSKYKNAVAGRDEGLAEVAQRYDAALAERGKRDFDDLLGATLELVRARPELARYRHVLVDEFQDTSEIQYELAQLLAQTGDLFVIGDPLQSIYGFRGASGDVFERFAADFPQVRRVDLTMNYRSGKGIVAVGNAVFEGGVKLEAAAGAEAGVAQTFETLNEYSEAAWIVAQIESGVGGTGMLTGGEAEVGMGFRDYAVLYRTHRSAAAVVRRLAESGLPYQVAGEGSPYERPEVAAVVAALGRLAGDAVADETADKWLDVEVRPLVGQVSVAELAEAVAARLGGFDDEAKWRELAWLGSVLVRFGSDAEAAARYFEGLREAEYYDPAAEAITLATIHAAKGLEFAHVFVLGVEEGLLPHARPGQTVADVDEERRLFYVAATRAKRRLDLVHARERGGKAATMSRFVRGLPLAGVVDPDIMTLARKRTVAQAKRAQGRLF